MADGTFQVDGRTFAARPDDNLLHACLSEGLDLPYFCWHPTLGSVGACRQCAVKHFRDEQDREGRLVMACMTPATDGTRISIEDAEAVAFRTSVIEWLMTNHPHDCPVCEEGGECHLQDMTHLTGHVYRRYRFTKRTHRNQYLGPFVKHEMNRCIACYRCVRFYREYAGGRDLDVFGAHNDVYFGRQADGVLQSEYSGNLVEICPTGVFTDKTFSERYTRKWDLQGAASVCVHCAVGCNTFPNARAGELRRVINRFHRALNGYFICDRGRYGYGFVNAATRVRVPHEKRAGELAPITRSLALEQLVTFLRETDDGGAPIGIGSPRASLEANFALRELVGPEQFYQGVDDEEARLLARVLELMRGSGVAIASLQDVEAADAALLLGEPVPDTAPRMALSLRQMVRHASYQLAHSKHIPAWQDAAVRDNARDAVSPLFILTSRPTRLDDVAALSSRLTAIDAARLAHAVAHELDARQPSVEGLPPALQSQAGQMAGALRSAERPLILTGITERCEPLIAAAAWLAATLARAGRAVRLALVVPECNSLGLALLGGRPLSEALAQLTTAPARTAIVLENDLYRRAPRQQVDAALAGARHLVVLDHTLQSTARRASLLLPAATYAESSGTLINFEARAQRFWPVLLPEEPIAPSWRWLNEAACALRPDSQPWASLDAAIAALVERVPSLAAVQAAAPPADYRIHGSRIASAPHRQSGRTALLADRTVHEPTPPRDPDAAYSHTMEGFYGQMSAALYPFFWAPDWNSEQGLNKFQQEVGGPLRGGQAGARLFEPDGAAQLTAPMVPEPFRARQDQWLLVPEPRVFGSDELSVLTPALAERIEPATLGLNAADAARLQLQEGEPVRIDLPHGMHTLPLAINSHLPEGVASVPVGLPALPWMPLPCWARLQRAAP
jgi:NADH-quinone oxidoreductase subunit G